MTTTTGTKTGSKKAGQKSGAQRRREAKERAQAAADSSTKPAGNGAGKGGDDFTSGDVNENIREPVGVAPASRKGKTGELFADRKIPELHKAAEEYVATRDARMELNSKEVQQKDKLIQLMKKHKKEEYDCDGLKITFEHVEEDKLKVKLQKPDADDAG
jgi:hypothetical protein